MSCPGRQAKITAVDTGLANQLGQADIGDYYALGNSGVAEVLTEAKDYNLTLLLRREMVSGHGGDGNGKTFSGSWPDA